MWDHHDWYSTHAARLTIGGNPTNTDVLIKRLKSKLDILASQCYLIELESRDMANVRVGLRKIVQTTLSSGRPLTDHTRIQKHVLRLIDPWIEYQAINQEQTPTLVVVLRNLEAVDPQVVNELLQFLAIHKHIDFRVLCDTATSLEYLDDIFTTKTTRLLGVRIYETELNSSVLDKIVTRQLIDRSSGLRLSYETFSDMHSTFLRTRSVDGFVSALKYAKLCHHWNHDLAHIAESDRPVKLTSVMLQSIKKRGSFRLWVEAQLNGDLKAESKALNALTDENSTTETIRSMISDIQQHKTDVARAFSLLIILKEHVRSSAVQAKSIAEIYKTYLRQGLVNSNVVKEILMSLK